MNRTSLTSITVPSVLQRVRNVNNKFACLQLGRCIYRGQNIHWEFGKLSGNPIVFAPFVPPPSRSNRPFGAGRSTSPPLYTLYIIIPCIYILYTYYVHTYLERRVPLRWCPLCSTRRRALIIGSNFHSFSGKLMYRVYIIAGRTTGEFPRRALWHRVRLAEFQIGHT